jgi:hypothetical protein
MSARGGSSSQGSGGSTGAGGIVVTGGATGGTGGKTTTGAGGIVATGGTPGATGGKATGGAGGAAGASVQGGGAGAVTSAGNPNGSCGAGVPTRGQAADISNPTSVVGNGASCSFSDLQAAATKGGVITFNCGSGAVTIPVTATLNLPTTKNTVIDGGNKITLDGGDAVQILRFDSPDFQANTNGLTLQHITLINGKSPPRLSPPLRRPVRRDGTTAKAERCT